MRAGLYQEHCIIFHGVGQNRTWLALAHRVGQQVIPQVWILSHFGVISNRLPATDETMGFIAAMFTPL
jgi:hypothetical protein